MAKPYLIDSIVGNSRMLAALAGDGELHRVFWPHIDGGQHIQRLLCGVAAGGRPVVWQNDRAVNHEQAYEPDQNVAVTTSRLGAGLEATTRDAAAVDTDVLVRHVTVTNRGAAPAGVTYVVYQWLRIDESAQYNTVLFDEAADSLIHYRRDVFVALGADREMSAFKVGRPAEVLEWAEGRTESGDAVMHGGVESGGTLAHHDAAGAATWDLGVLAPGETVELTVFWTFGHAMNEVRSLLAGARQAGGQALLGHVRAYWTEWLSRAKPIHVPARTEPNRPVLPGIPARPATPEQVEALYKRSLLTFKLLSDEKTGAVIAAPEFDEGCTACGGYAFVWGRDAAYITTAMDYAGYHDLAVGFYRWALSVQEPEGWWMHRHTVTGHWGPSWGLIQVDETGSILYGMAVHARLHGGEAFARSVWAAVQKAADFLVGYIDPETGLPSWSFDLWEERNEKITYSSAAVYAGLKAAADLAAMVGEAEVGARYSGAAEALQAAVLRECVREGRFLRGRHLQVSRTKWEQAKAAGAAVRERKGPKGTTLYEIDEDPVPDASLFGMATPFGLVSADHPVMVKTADALVEHLWMHPGGGIVRYTGDPYRGGRNPWVLTTLWLGQYQAERGNREYARQILDWAVARQTQTGLLPEQVNPATGAAEWVVPLTWSHAMYVLLALQLYGE